MKVYDLRLWTSLTLIILLSACDTSTPPITEPLPPPPKQVGDPLVIKGRELFFKETFNGNGRTCGTCHREDHNLTIDAAFIDTLPNNDPLFVAEFKPELSQNFENPKLMREFGLILENHDGPDTFTMRSVPHVFAQRVSIASNPNNRFHCFSDTQCPRTGWSGDGAPATQDLKAFALGAVIQHFTKSLNRKAGVDFRLPTEEELIAMEAYQLSEGRQEDLKLPLPLKSVVAAKGQQIFNSPTQGKCFFCHFNAGANVGPGSPLGQGNLNFNTGVEDLPDQPEDLLGEPNNKDDGLGTPGDGTFNTPSVVEAADTGPFFHNHSVATIEGSVAFYNGDAFNNSPAGQAIRGGASKAINLDATQVVSVAAFLRVINALHNIDELDDMLGAVARNEYLDGEHPHHVVKRSLNDIDDAIMVLAGGSLHPDAVSDFREARALTEEAVQYPSRRIKLAAHAQKVISRAKSRLVN
ncbi:MAG: hypothetical protein ACXW0Q_11920 [Methylovulum sp.]